MSKWTKEAIDRIKELYADHTYEEIAEDVKEKFGMNKTANAIRKVYERHAIEPKEFSKAQNKPKILLFDIETFPMEAYIWSLRQEGVGLPMLKEDWSVLGWAAKWYGEDEIFYEDVRIQRNLRDDKRIVKKLHKLLDEADIVVGQNSDSFDIKKMNARFIKHGLKPPSSFKKLDTLKMARKHFKFTSNKLEYLTEHLCTKYKKLKHEKFPGFSMWKECLNRNMEAFDAMEEYNRFDVLSLEELFDKLLPWENANLFHLYNGDLDPTCTCGSKDFKKNGFYYTNASKFQRYTCRDCGSEYRDTKNLISKDKKKMSGTKR